MQHRAFMRFFLDDDRLSKACLIESLEEEDDIDDDLSLLVDRGDIILPFDDQESGDDGVECILSLSSSMSSVVRGIYLSLIFLIDVEHLRHTTWLQYYIYIFYVNKSIYIYIYI